MIKINKKKTSKNLSSSLSAVFNVWLRNYFQFKKTWLISFFWIVLEPAFILTGLGFGLGSFVIHINGQSYIDFLFPGLLCTSSMMVAFFECTYPTYTKMSYQKIYDVMLYTPIEPSTIVWGEVLWGATKGTLSAVGITAVASAFGLVDTLRIFPGFIIIFLNSCLFAAFGMLVTSLVRSYDQIIYPSSGLIIPLSIFSGTYFPIENLPLYLKLIFYLSPLSHAVSGLRCILSQEIFPSSLIFSFSSLNNFDPLAFSSYFLFLKDLFSISNLLELVNKSFVPQILFHLLILILITLLLIKYAIAQLKKRLVK